MKTKHSAAFAWMLLSGAAVAQTTQPMAQAAQSINQQMAQSGVYPFDPTHARRSVNGSESRDVLRGILKSGEAVGVHESMQPPGAAPVAMHIIQHSELILVQEGTVGFEHDGKTEQVGPGGVIYVAIGTLHRVKNIGDGPAKYFVVQIGGDTKK